MRLNALGHQLFVRTCLISNLQQKDRVEFSWYPLWRSLVYSSSTGPALYTLYPNGQHKQVWKYLLTNITIITVMLLSLFLLWVVVESRLRQTASVEPSTKFVHGDWCFPNLIFYCARHLFSAELQVNVWNETKSDFRESSSLIWQCCIHG